MLNFYKTVHMDEQNIHFLMLKYILNYCFQCSKVGENGDF